MSRIEITNPGAPEPNPAPSAEEAPRKRRRPKDPRRDLAKAYKKAVKASRTAGADDGEEVVTWQSFVPPREQLRDWAIAAAFIVLLWSASSIYRNWTNYPQLNTHEQEALAALRTAVSVKKLEWVDDVTQELNRQAKSGKLSEGHRRNFDAIITLARSGDWKTAESRCIRFQKDQLVK